MLFATVVVKVNADDAKNIGILPQLTIPLYEGEQKFYLFHQIMPTRVIPALYIPVGSIDINFNTTKGVEVLTNRLNRINKASGLTFWGPDSITGVRAEEIWSQYFFLLKPAPDQIIEMVALTPDGKFIKISRLPYPGERIWCIKFSDGSPSIAIISDICCNTVVSALPNLQGKILMKRDGTSGNNPGLQDGGGQQQQIIYVNGDGSKKAGSNNGQPIVIYVQGAQVTNSGNSGSKSIGGFGGESTLTMPNQETGLAQTRALPLTVSTVPTVMNPVNPNPVYTTTAATTSACGNGCGGQQYASVCSHGRKWPPGTGFYNYASGLSQIAQVGIGIARFFYPYQYNVNVNGSSTVIPGVNQGTGGPAGGASHF